MQVEVQFSDLQTEGEGIWKQQDIFKTTLIFEKYRSYNIMHLLECVMVQLYAVTAWLHHLTLPLPQNKIHCMQTEEMPPCHTIMEDDNQTHTDETGVLLCWSMGQVLL